MRLTVITNGEETVWEATNIVVATAAVLTVLAFIVEHWLGIRPSFWSITWTLLAVIGTARMPPTLLLMLSSRCGLRLPGRRTPRSGLDASREPGKVTYE
jgi:hypothetical protein